jgi:hypothetical protein
MLIQNRTVLDEVKFIFKFGEATRTPIWFSEMKSFLLKFSDLNKQTHFFGCFGV